MTAKSAIYRDTRNLGRSDGCSRIHREKNSRLSVVLSFLESTIIGEKVIVLSFLESRIIGKKVVGPTCSPVIPRK